MKLVSYFSELRLIYYALAKIKAFSRNNKLLSKKKSTEVTRGSTRAWHVARWRHHDVTLGSALLTSAVGPADVSVDQVNVDR